MSPRGTSVERWVDRSDEGAAATAKHAGGDGLVSVAPGGDRPWRGEAEILGGVGSGRTMRFLGEACAKGTALVADAREDAMRGPRSQRATRGGSSGGRSSFTQDGRPSSSIRSFVDLTRTPRAERRIVRCCARSRAEKDIRVVETAEMEAAGTGQPARKERSLSWRTLHAIRNVEGEQNPMRGGRTHWARTGRHVPRWMSTGRPRVMR